MGGRRIHGCQVLHHLHPVEGRLCASDEGRGKRFKRDEDAQHSMAWRVAIAKGLKDGEPQEADT